MKSLLLLVAGTAMLLIAQTPEPAVPAFEVASVRISKGSPPRPPVSFGAGEMPPPPRPPFAIRTSPETLTVVNATLMECFTWAYGFRRWQIAGPDWIAADRYDIVAKASMPVAEEQMKRMLQGLLTDRFRMTLRREKRDLPVMALVVTKDGPKLQASKPDTKSGVDVSYVKTTGGTRWSFQNSPLDRLEGILSGPHWDPVLNRTGLAGGFDFTYERPGLDDDSGASPGFGIINAALQKQLGLKLERQKSPVDFLVIERAERVPTEN